jgi:nicotinate-nucleotide adenylyltransferase
MKRLGVIGGRFDPIHNGHLILAQDVMETLDLEEVLFILSYHPPHKAVGTSFSDRWRMLELALSGVEKLRASDVERRLDLEKSYTVPVLEAVKSEEGDCELHFLLGSDQFGEIHKWYDPQRLGRLARIVVLKRPGGHPRYPEIENIVPDVFYFDQRSIDISSSEIRERVKQGHSIHFFVPEAVEHYIIESGLYR